MSLETPVQVAKRLAVFFAGDVISLSVCECFNDFPATGETLSDWTVRARVQPHDKRRRHIDVHESASTREGAIAHILEMAPIWAQTEGCKPRA